MNKMAKTIIGILVGIIVVLVIVIVILATRNNGVDEDIYQNSNETRDMVGIYYSSNNSSTLKLKDDMTCEYYGFSRYGCKWSVSGKEITILLNQYHVDFDESADKSLGSIGDGFESKEVCEQALEEYTKQYGLVNPRCYDDERYKHIVNVSIIDSGLLIGNKIYNKIG